MDETVYRWRALNHAVKEAIFEYDAEYIVKPFEVDVLKSTIARAIAEAEAED